MAANNTPILFKVTAIRLRCHHMAKDCFFAFQLLPKEEQECEEPHPGGTYCLVSLVLKSRIIGFCTARCRRHHLV